MQELYVARRQFLNKFRQEREIAPKSREEGEIGSVSRQEGRFTLLYLPKILNVSHHGFGYYSGTHTGK